MKSYHIKKITYGLSLMLLDSIFLFLSLYISVMLRFDLVVPSAYLSLFWNSAPIVVGIFLLYIGLFGLYKRMWKYASVEVVFQVSLACGLAGISSFLLNNYLNQNWNYIYLGSRGIYAIFTMISMVVVGGLRIVLKALGLISHHSFLQKSRARRVMVVGAGWAGASTIRDIKAGRQGNCYAVLAVDDDLSRVNTRIHGVKVLEGTDNIKKYTEIYKIDEIIIAIATPKGNLEELISSCVDTGCKVRRVSNIQEINQENEGSLSVVRDVDIIDLLGRPEEKLDTTKVKAYFDQKTVLITGGGGSIGSELCRQIVPYNIKKIILFDMSENYIYDLRTELLLKFGKDLDSKLLLCVGSVQDSRRLEEVFAQHKPEIVLHAAAHKHVPLMEDCPTQAVLNNVIGSYNTAKLAKKYGANSFVLISTDKAVNPTNIMGATKRLSELIIEGLNANTKTKFIIVRFGNVLGSHGSVVHIFEQQIRAGGPVTVTDEKVIRYFMSIHEAAQLVLQAASFAQGGELFVLEMGKPVKIVDLAERMIKLYSDPNKPKVEIAFVGMRQGEKILEELLSEDEGIIRTDVDKIRITKSDIISEEESEEILRKIFDTIEKGESMRDCLKELVPTFKEPHEVNEQYQNISLENRKYAN